MSRPPRSRRTSSTGERGVNDLFEHTALVWVVVVVAQAAALQLVGGRSPVLASALFVPWSVPRAWPARAAWAAGLAVAPVVMLLCGGTFPVRLAVSAAAAGLGVIHDGPARAALAAGVAAVVHVWAAGLPVFVARLEGSSAWLAPAVLLGVGWADVLVLQPLFQHALPTRGYAPLLTVWFTLPWLFALTGLRELGALVAVLLLSPTTWVVGLGRRVDSSVWCTCLAGALMQAHGFSSVEIVARASVLWSTSALVLLLDAAGYYRVKPRAPGAAPMECFPYLLFHAVSVSLLCA